MNIGSVTLTPNGELIGQLAMMCLDARIAFHPVEGASERAPRFEVMALNVAKRWVRLGALWEKEARETGEAYLTGHLDDPSLPSRLYVAAFRQPDGGYAIAWSRLEPAGRGGLVATEVDPSSGPEAPAPRRRSRATPPANEDPFG